METRSIALSLALGAFALSGTPSANAASVQSQPSVAATVNATVQSTDVSARRYWRGWRGHHRVIGVYPRHYRSYDYYPPPYYYYYPPAVSFRIGYGGSPRFYRNRYHAPWLGVGY